MRYSVSINQKKCAQFGISANDGALMDILNQLSSWAQNIIVGNEVYYNLAYGKILEELPLFFKKKDTIYRSILKLKNEGFLEQKKFGRDQKNYIKLTQKGKNWNKSNMSLRVGNESDPQQGSDLNPSRVGNESDPRYLPNVTNKQSITVQGSDLNPTYKIISTTSNTYKADLKIFSKVVGVYFGKDTEEQQMKVFGFLLQLENQIYVFQNQFHFYKEYKKLSGEKIHRFENFYREWNEQNWKLLFVNLKNTNVQTEPLPTYLKKIS